MKKKLLAYSVGALCVGAIAYPAWKMTEEKLAYDKDYQEQLDLIVEGIEIEHWKKRSDPITWKINVEIPENVDYERWEQYEVMPRVLFGAKEKNEKYYSLYSMRINGSDIKLVANYDDLGGQVMALGDKTGPSRSPYGRYIISTVYNKGYSCILYDMKERKSQKIASKSCHVESWNADGKSALVSSSGESAFLTLNNLNFEYLKSKYGEDFENANDTFFIIESRKVAVSKIKVRNNFLSNVAGEGSQVVYDFPSFKNPRIESYLSDECLYGGTYSVDKKYFTCKNMNNFNSNKFNVYSIDNPKDVIGESIGFKIIKPGIWAIQDERIYRVVQDDEDSPLSVIKYKYDAGNKYDITVYNDLYLPYEKISSFNRLELSDYFPELPSKEKYEDSWRKLLYP